jgi:hypothetical protein
MLTYYRYPFGQYHSSTIPVSILTTPCSTLASGSETCRSRQHAVRCGEGRGWVGWGGVEASRAAVVQLARELCESVRRRRVLLAPLLLLAHVLQPTADADHRRLGRPLTHARACAHKHTGTHERFDVVWESSVRLAGPAVRCMPATAVACCYRRAGTSVRSCSTVLKLSVDFIRSVFRDCHAIAMIDRSRPCDNGLARQQASQCCSLSGRSEKEARAVECSCMCAHVPIRV